MKAKTKVKTLSSVYVPNFGDKPLYDEDVEIGVLGAIMMDEEAIEDVIDILNVNCFYSLKNKKIYQACLQLFHENEAIDFLTVRDRIQKNGADIDKDYLSLLSHRVCSAAHLQIHARILAEYEMRRKMAILCKKIGDAVSDKQNDVFDLKEAAEKSLYELTQDVAKRDFLDGTQLMQVGISNMELAVKNKGVIGVKTNFEEVDRLLGGLKKSQLIVVAARPSMGKTSFLVSLFDNVAALSEKKVAFFSLEMSKHEIAARLLSRKTGYDFRRITRGQLGQGDWQKIHERVAGFENLFLDETQALSILEIRAKVRRLKSKHNIEVVIVDYMQLLVGEKGTFSNREQEIASISRGLKAIAKEFDVTIITAAQLSRAVETRGGDKIPMLSDLRDSGAIEQDADVVMFLYRPEYYGIGDMEAENLCEVIVSKHRNGPTGKIKLKFDASCMSFSNWDKDSFVKPF